VWSCLTIIMTEVIITVIQVVIISITMIGEAIITIAADFPAQH
jgi:uncharacterized protein with HEPN domain